LRDRIPNFPFLHNKRIADRDVESGGGLRRCIRLIKSIRSDSDDDIAFSSYDIAALCYRINPAELLTDSDVTLAMRFVEFSARVHENSALRDSLKVPNETRPIFGGSEGASLTELGKLAREAISVLEAAAGGRA
jgi:hypothetical protein